MKAVYLTNDEEADLDGDGNVNAIDMAIMKSFFYGVPGPGGAATD